MLEKRVTCQVSIGNMQFGFMPDKYGMMGLEKTLDRVLREVVKWALRKLGVYEWLVHKCIMALYSEVCTVVRTDVGLSESFYVKVLSLYCCLLPCMLSPVR